MAHQFEVARLKGQARQEREQARQEAMRHSKALAESARQVQEEKENAANMHETYVQRLQTFQAEDVVQKNLLSEKDKQLQRNAQAERQLKRKQATMQKKLEEVRSNSQPASRPPVQTCVPDAGPSSDNMRRRYDYIRNQYIRLKEHFQQLYLDGSCGETVLEVLTYFLDHNQKFAAELFMELELPQAIEREVVEALQSWWTPEKAAALRQQTGMTWDGYRLLSTSYMQSLDPEIMQKVDIKLPYGSSPPRMPRTYRLIEYEKGLVQQFGLTESSDGIAAWVDLIKLAGNASQRDSRGVLSCTSRIAQIFLGG